MAKISVTPTIVLAEFILFGKKVSTRKVATATFLISIKFSLTTVNSTRMSSFF